ncbi:LacI family DNA-binding transcriptional regulator [Gordonia sp. CPCC 205515]|uniref:LacI family DNA-binding transcriptional regulator n=1 Tax=Gordonia sp. CPCC 205515 TaxID=3140791 RepID=UPI003AF373E5
MSVTSRDVARLAGVSQPTVSRALRGDTRVAEATRLRVAEAADALGYVPSEAGRSLVTRMTRRIGIVVTDLTNPFYPQLVGPLHDELEKHGYRIMVFAERTDSLTAVEHLVDGSVDGVVLLTTTLGSRLPSELTRRGVPFVCLNRESGSGLDDAAVVDNELGGKMAADHLVELGHRRIAGIFGPEDTSTGRDRELGFRFALAEAGIAIPVALTAHGPFDFDTGHAEMQRFLDMANPPTAVFCGNDVVAIGALNAAVGAGARVPGDVSIVGFDDIPMASWEAFRLTTVAYDLSDMAVSAARLLVRRLGAQADDQPQREVMVPSLIVRGTTAVPCS